jgi:hypothetical protein
LHSSFRTQMVVGADALGGYVAGWQDGNYVAVLMQES